MEQLHHKKHNFGYNSAETYTRLGDLEATTQQVLDTSRYTQCRIPYKVTQATVQRTEVWRVNLQHGNLKSPGTKGTTKHQYQTTSKSQYYSTKQKEHYNNTYNFEQVQSSVMLMYVSSFLSIIEQVQHFQRCKPNNKHSTQVQVQQTHNQWTSAWCTKEKESTRAKERATKDKAKERHNGRQDTATVDMVKEKHRHQLATAMLSKDQDTQPSKERQKAKDPLHGKETKEKAKEHATDVDRWGTWQKIAAYECSSWQKQQANKARTNNSTTMRRSTTNNSMTHITNNGVKKKHGSTNSNGFQSNRHKSTHSNHQPYNRHPTPALLAFVPPCCQSVNVDEQVGLCRVSCYSWSSQPRQGTWTLAGLIRTLSFFKASGLHGFMASWSDFSQGPDAICAACESTLRAPLLSDRGCARVAKHWVRRSGSRRLSSL